MTVVAQSPDVTAAEQAWADLRSALVNFDKAVVRIIETRAWEPLGYASFGEAWVARMSGTRLATAASAARVVYALIDSGLNRDQVVKALGPSSGVGPAKVDVLTRQKDAGVPAEFATTQVRRSEPPAEPMPTMPPDRGLSVVRTHYRAPRSEPHIVRVELAPDEYEHFKAVAERHGMDLATVAARAVKAEFARLERRGGE